MLDPGVHSQQVIEEVDGANSSDGMIRDSPILIESSQRSTVLPMLAKGGLRGSCTVEESAGITGADVLAHRNGDGLSGISMKLRATPAGDRGCQMHLAKPRSREAFASTLHDRRPSQRCDRVLQPSSQPAVVGLLGQVGMHARGLARFRPPLHATVLWHSRKG